MLDATWPLSEGAEGLEAALLRVCAEATAAIEAGHQFIVLSDRAQGARAQAQLPFPLDTPKEPLELSQGIAGQREIERGPCGGAREWQAARKEGCLKDLDLTLAGTSLVFA